MISLYDGQITDLLPWKIAQSTEVRCISYAVQQEEIVFGEGRTEEWFDYTEGPYTPGTFDIITNARMTEEMANYFLSIIQRVKNTRSHIRRILVEREMEMHETVASGVVSSPKEQVLNHHQTTNDYTMQETAASAVTSAPSRTVTNHPEGRTGDIGMEGNAAAAAVSSPHETIGNNVNPRTGTLSGGVSGFAAIVVRNTKTTILNQRNRPARQGTGRKMHNQADQGRNRRRIIFRWRSTHKQNCSQIQEAGVRTDYSDDPEPVQCICEIYHHK